MPDLYTQLHDYAEACELDERRRAEDARWCPPEPPTPQDDTTPADAPATEETR